MDFAINWWFVMALITSIFCAIQAFELKTGVNRKPIGTFEIYEDETTTRVKFIVEQDFENFKDGDIVNVQIRRVKDDEKNND